MAMLTVLANPILPVFLILAVGFVFGRVQWMSVADARMINRFAMTVLIPILLFDLLANAPYETFSLAPLMVYALVQAVIFALGYGLANRVFGLAPGEAVILGYAGIFANNVYYGLPISVLLYGEGGVLPITMIVILDSTLSFGAAMIALQVIQHGTVSVAGIVRIFWRTPPLIAMFLGLSFGLSGAVVPDPVQTFLDFNGQAAAPVALFALGVVLSRTVFRMDGAVATTIAIKLALFPAAIALAMIVFGTGGWDDAQRFVFGAAAPAGATALSLAMLYGVSTDRIGQVLVWTSVLTVFSLAMLA